MWFNIGIIWYEISINRYLLSKYVYFFWHSLYVIKRELSLSPEPATTIADFQHWVQNAWDNLSQDDIRHLHDRFHARIHAWVAAKGGYTALMWLFGHLLLWHVCFVWSEFVIIYSYNDKLYLSHHFAIQWTFPWGYYIFSGSVYIAGKR